MKAIERIKRNINKLNNYCTNKGLSLFSYLELQQLSINDFCNLIGLNTIFLNDIAISTLKEILKDPTTRIFYNKDMESLENEEISIYSKNLKISFNYLVNRIKILWDHTINTNDFRNYRSEYLSTRYQDGSLVTIHFSSDTIIDFHKLLKYSLSENYLLDHVNLKIKYLVTKDNLILEEKSFQITINHDMNNRDLQNVFRILYNFNFPLAVTILKLYPSELKIMSDEVEMNNFHKL